jgi:hypothetical protein
MWIKRIKLLVTVIFALLSLARGAHGADSCSDMALAIAMSSKLESGGLSKDGSLIPLIGDPYGAYLSCSGPAGMSLRYVGPSHPPDDWYALVSKTGSVLLRKICSGCSICWGKQTNNPAGYGDRFRMDTTGVVWAVTLLVVVPLLGIAAAPWLVYPITKLVGVASYLYLLPL